MGQGMDGMNESWEPEDNAEIPRQRRNNLLPEEERLRVEADGLFKRVKKAEEKNKALTAERDQLRAENERLRDRADRSGRALTDVYSHLTAATARAKAAERERDEAQAHAADLRGALEPFAAFGKYIQEHPRSGLSELLYSWDAQYDIGITKTALRNAHEMTTRTPAQSMSKCRSEALREMARKVYEETDSEVARCIIELILEEADRLEAADGR